jgi:hypothetical protein
VLARMKKGEALHRHHSWYGPAWFLTRGQSVPTEVAQAVISNKNIADVGDGLFANGPSQTWRWFD